MSKRVDWLTPSPDPRADGDVFGETWHGIEGRLRDRVGRIRWTSLL